MNRGTDMGTFESKVQSTILGHPHLILDELHEGVVVFDTDLTIIYANRAYGEILGVDLAKVMGRKIRDIEPHTKALSCLETGVPIRDEYDVVEILHKHVIYDAIPPFQNGTGHTVVTVFRDVSEVARLSNLVQHLEARNQALSAVDAKSKYTLPEPFRILHSNSKEFQNVITFAAKISRTDASVLIQGGSGVGKELVARAIHASSDRSQGPFVAVNCAAVNDTLGEGEFFGCVEGAFMGAIKGWRHGRVEQANGGTLFLDEVVEIPLAMQSKLLRVLQSGEVQKIGSSGTLNADVCVLSATNRNLRQEIANGRFRDDSFYRLTVISVDIPVLRTRPEDIHHLVDHFTAGFCEKHRRHIHFSDSARRILLNYRWLGNVRELENVVQHGVIVALGNLIDPIDLPEYLRTSASVKNAPRNRSEKLDEAVDTAEHLAIVDALNKTQQNRTAAMKILGISRHTFYNKFRKHSLL